MWLSMPPFPITQWTPTMPADQSESPAKWGGERGRNPAPRHRTVNGNNNQALSTCPPSLTPRIPETSNGVMYSMRQKLSNNLEHYSNMLQDMALPVLLTSRNRSGSRHRRGRGSVSRERAKKHRNSSPFPDRTSDEEDFVFVESIELCHLDGFVAGGSREHGRGHKFVVVHLKSPTWCDKCGDFIWGVYKQCLCCTSEYPPSLDFFSMWF